MSSFKRTSAQLAALLAAFGAGCGDASREQARETYAEAKETVRQKAHAAGDALADAWDRVAGFTAERKDRFYAAMQASRDALEAEADKLRKESENVSEAAVERFRRAGAEFEASLRNAAEASSEAWGAAKDDVRKAWNDFVDAFQKLRSQARKSKDAGDA